MKRTLVAAALLLPLAAWTQGTIATRLAKWKTVEMPFQTAGLSGKERQMVDKLVEASRLLDDIYWRQGDASGLAMYKGTTDLSLKRLLLIMGCRWDLLDENRPFTKSEPMPPGHE